MNGWHPALALLRPMSCRRLRPLVELPHGPPVGADLPEPSRWADGRHGRNLPVSLSVACQVIDGTMVML